MRHGDNRTSARRFLRGLHPEEFYLNHISPLIRATRWALAFALLPLLPRIALAQHSTSDASADRSTTPRAESAANVFAAHLDNIDYRGWHAIRLSNGLISLIIVPQIGGRAIQLKLGEQELFFVN